MDTIDRITSFLKEWATEVDYWSIRYLETDQASMSSRRGVIAPSVTTDDRGVMIMVWIGDAYGYGASSCLTKEGLYRAFCEARDWALSLAGKLVAPISTSLLPRHIGQYSSPVERSWWSEGLDSKLDFLQSSSAKLKCDSRIVDWSVHLQASHTRSYYRSSADAAIDQEFYWMQPHIAVTAHANGETERRSFGGQAVCRQGGMEVLEQAGFWQAVEEVPQEALALLSAPNCPDETLDILLAPDQMILQIHESIGHPLELDRILGDERNYAGRSFVSREMFGTYQYGSELLNVSFDPTVSGEIASYAYDDEGTRAEKVYLIRAGILQAGLGGFQSQHRSGLPGVANSRATNWNRPPIDRMANLNLEAGDSSFADMVASVERGVYMRTNSSWSIDDSRNKFQFGCEWGQMIENGSLTHVVRKPNYRGISANFWKSLSHVGNKESLEVLGTPYCGKGEPNQAIGVGHATPACVFRGVQVFGGE